MGAGSQRLVHGRHGKSPRRRKATDASQRIAALRCVRLGVTRRRFTTRPGTRGRALLWRVMCDGMTAPFRSPTQCERHRQSSEEITSMHQEQWTAVDAFFCDLLLPPDAHLEAVLHTSEAAGL